MVDRSTSSLSDANEPRGSQPQRAVDICPGDVIYVPPQVIFDDRKRVLAGEVLLVISADEANVAGVYLDQMTTEAVANQLPALAQKLTKPKVFFLGGADVPGAVVAIGQLSADVDVAATGAGDDAAEGAVDRRATGAGDDAAEGTENGTEQPSEHAFQPAMICDGRALLIDAEERLAQVVITENQEWDVPVENLRLFVGFTELARTELDEWLAEGSVQFQRAVAEDVFGSKPGETWRQLMKRRPFPENLFSTWAEHPERN
ncbi:YqgE/AlgH family protein [Corynebacterium sp. HMSC28B08]|uniref:YqgE/AlgH family protein n=1 Tax=Corynebacterium sp. HMSC28B08 TaxID=1581066 RepID=UPI0008A270E7|nr:YqgE/AlgH family protein [Corynebacterium sp. HMSC28B08]OFT89289.1 hypothetical protein HMPREF3098_06105 [Corynebacterium sp. HMSC28B08]